MTENQITVTEVPSDINAKEIIELDKATMIFFNPTQAAEELARLAKIENELKVQF